MSSNLSSVEEAEQDAISCLAMLATVADSERSVKHEFVSFQAAKLDSPSIPVPPSPPCSALSLRSDSDQFGVGPLFHKDRILNQAASSNTLSPISMIQNVPLYSNRQPPVPYPCINETNNSSQAQIQHLQGHLPAKISATPNHENPRNAPSSRQIFLAPPTAGTIRANKFQVKVLISIFAENPLPSGAMHEAIAERIGMSKKAVRNWFQNNRAKARKEQEAKGNSSAVDSFQESPVTLYRQEQEATHDRNVMILSSGFISLESISAFGSINRTISDFVYHDYTSARLHLISIKQRFPDNGWIEEQDRLRSLQTPVLDLDNPEGRYEDLHLNDIREQDPLVPADQAAFYRLPMPYRAATLILLAQQNLPKWAVPQLQCPTFYFLVTPNDPTDRTRPIFQQYYHTPDFKSLQKVVEFILVRDLMVPPAFLASLFQLSSGRKEACAHFEGFLFSVTPKLIAAGSDPEHFDDIIFLSAARFGNTNVVRLLLLDDRVDPCVAGGAAIRDAASNGHTKVVKLLLADKRVDPNARGYNALTNASLNGHVEVVEALLKDPRTDPAVMTNLAIRQAENAEIVKLLVFNARVDPTEWNSAALRSASASGNSDVVAILLADGRSDPSAEDNEAIRMAAVANGPARQKQKNFEMGYLNPLEMLTHTASKSMKHDRTRRWPTDYLTPRKELVVDEHDLSGFNKVVSLLLGDSRVNPTANSNEALHSAIHHGNVDIVQQLLADPRVAASQREIGDSLVEKTATNYIKRYSRFENILALLASPSFDVGYNDNELFIIAASEGFTKMVEVMLASKNPRFNPCSKDNDALLRAAIGGHVDVVAILLNDSRIDPTAGLTNNECIAAAAEIGQAEIVKLLLLDPRVDPSAENNAAIRAAKENGHDAIVKILEADDRVKRWNNK
ncbi:UNVERIFIED_CONTAM: hypothetical protein HDU68_003623 [Siphonaria sp. JEL0065]|nr:hypothetical protein HDU68_003623 [Siphonaria sp. JEL0065]